jgi:hypothetical protein
MRTNGNIMLLSKPDGSVNDSGITTMVTTGDICRTHQWHERIIISNDI